MKKILFFTVLGLVLAVPIAASAMTVKSGQDIIVTENIKGNFFGAGNLIMINGTVDGDVFVAGNSISIKGTVNGDVFAAGSNVEVFGTINGNLRAVGSNIRVLGKVARNVLAAGATLIVDQGALVGGNLTCAGGTLFLQGPIGSEVNAAGQNITLGSSINGNVNLRLGSNNKKQPSQLTVSDQAKITGDLNYKSPSQADIQSGATISGKTNYTPIPASPNRGAHNVLARMGWFVSIFGFLALFLAGLVLIYVFPKITERIYQMMKTKAWSDLGMGVVGFIVIPVIGLILMILVITIPLIFASWALFFIAVFFAKAMLAIGAGKWLAERFHWKLSNILCLLIGLVIMFLIGLIPFIGAIAVFLGVLWAFGAVLRVEGQIIKELR